MLVPSLARRIVLPHGWPALDEPDGADGLELWSLTTDAAEGWRTPAAAWRWLRDTEAEVAHGPPAQHLRRWDELSARRRMPAIAGLDGHAPGIRIRGRVRSPLSHARTFGLLRTHVIAERALTGAVVLDRATLTSALAAGSAWLSCPFVAPADGARLWAERGDGSTVPMGGECQAQSVALRLRLPRAADIRVLRDGSPWRAAHGTRFDLDADAPGGLPRRGAHRRPALAALQPDPPAMVRRRRYERSAWCSATRRTRFAVKRRSGRASRRGGVVAARYGART
jgi:hypothetical protein